MRGRSSGRSRGYQPVNLLKNGMSRSTESERLLPMKNPTQHLIAEVPRSVANKVRMTIGIDLGDVWSHYCTLNEDGEVLGRGRFRTSPSGRLRPRAVWAIGEGTHDSPRPLGKKAPDALHIAAVLISEALDQIPLLRAGPQRQEREHQACCYREQPCSQRQPQAHP